MRKFLWLTIGSAQKRKKAVETFQEKSCHVLVAHVPWHNIV